jgi:hypothetical protein
LRTIAESLDISLPLKRINQYIEVGVLPDPTEEPWIEEEIVKRLMKFRELQSESTSLSRRVVWLHFERFPVPFDKVQRAMADMLPTIDAPKRKMQAIERAGAWFSNLPSNKMPGLVSERLLPDDWRIPPKHEWAEILLSEETEAFRSVVGRLDYYSGLLEYMGNDPTQTLVDIPKAERIALLTVMDLAKSQAIRRSVLAREEARERDRLKATA